MLFVAVLGGHCGPAVGQRSNQNLVLYNAGVWDVDNVLEATFQTGEFEPHTLSIEVEDVPGVLNQVNASLESQCTTFQKKIVSQSITSWRQ